MTVVEVDGFLPEAVVDRLLFFEDDETKIGHPLAGGGRLRLGDALAADPDLRHLKKLRV